MKQQLDNRDIIKVCKDLLTSKHLCNVRYFRRKTSRQANEEDQSDYTVYDELKEAWKLCVCWKTEQKMTEKEKILSWQRVEGHNSFLPLISPFL